MNYIISVCRPDAAAVFGDICSELCLALSCTAGERRFKVCLIFWV